MTEPEEPKELPTQQPTYYVMPAPLPASGKAVAALVLGVVGLITCQLLSPVAIILGNQGKHEADSGQAGGRELAVAGVVLGWIGTVLLLVVLVVGLLAGVLFGLGGLVRGSFNNTSSVVTQTATPEWSPISEPSSTP
jgi:hypothetical protein